jgi:hypothetical protein
MSVITQMLVENIHQFGFSYVGVAAGEDHYKEPSHIYTVGLVNFGLPELILIGNMNAGTMNYVMQTIGDRWIAQKGYSLDEVSDVIVHRDGRDPLPLRFAEVAVEPVVEKYMHQHWPAIQQRPLKMVQVIWPDQNGKFPDDPAFDSIQVGPQPLLELAR